MAARQWAGWGARLRRHCHPREQAENDGKNSVLHEMTGVGRKAQKYGRGPAGICVLKGLAHPIAWAVHKISQVETEHKLIRVQFRQPDWRKSSTSIILL